MADPVAPPAPYPLPARGEALRTRGVIVEVVTRKFEGDGCVFRVDDSKFHRTFTCQCPFNLPIEAGDLVVGVGKLLDDGVEGTLLYLLQLPFIDIGYNKDILTRSFVRAVRTKAFKTKQAEELYSVLLAETKDELGVYTYLNDLGLKWTNSGNNDDIFRKFTPPVKVDHFRALLRWWVQQRGRRRLLLLGLTKSEIRDMDLPYEELYRKIMRNPYSVYTVQGDKLDRIMTSLRKEIKPDDQRRGHIIRRVYDNVTKKSWTATPISCLVEEFPDVSDQIPFLTRDFGITFQYNCLFLPRQAFYEDLVCRRLQTLLNAPPILPLRSLKFSKDNLSDDQKEAVIGTLSNNVSYMGGPAGSGKTTTLKEITYNTDRVGVGFRTCAAIGKAVARYKKSVDLETARYASTFHWAIAHKDKIESFSLLLVEEVSMVTTELLGKFFEAFPEQYAVIFVGDFNQLPPIGWGHLLPQLLMSQQIPKFFLTNVHRLTKEVDANGLSLGRGILKNANNIISKSRLEEMPGFSLVSGDVRMVEAIVFSKKQDAIKKDQITILTPYNNELDRLNRSCQVIFDEHLASVQMPGTDVVWRTGDRVMMTKNCYLVDLFNGQEGAISALGPSSIFVKFDERDPIEFPFTPTPLDKEGKLMRGVLPVRQDEDDADDIEPGERTVKDLSVAYLRISYAMTIHKAQGSEWDYVIIYIPSGTRNYRSLNNKLLYTAITRAAKEVIIVSDDFRDVFGAALREPEARMDALVFRLVEANIPVEDRAQPPQDSIPEMSQVPPL